MFLIIVKTYGIILTLFVKNIQILIFLFYVFHYNRKNYLRNKPDLLPLQKFYFTALTLGRLLKKYKKLASFLVYTYFKVMSF